MCMCIVQAYMYIYLSIYLSIYPSIVSQDLDSSCFSPRDVDSLALIVFYKTKARDHHSSSVSITAGDIEDVLGSELVRQEKPSDAKDQAELEEADAASSSGKGHESNLGFDASRYTEFVQLTRSSSSDSNAQSPQKQSQSAKELRAHARELFKRLDGNNSGVVSSSELESYIRSVSALLEFPLSEEEASLFPKMLADQIDIDRSGSITVQELEQFLSFDSKQDIRELGVLVSLVRESMVRSCGVKFSDEDLDFMEKVTKYGRVPLHQGKDLIMSQSLKRILCRAGGLSPDEASNVLQNIDSNVDGVVSSRELKSWLFPKEASEDRKRLLDKLAALINESFEGDATLFVNRLQKRMSLKSDRVGLSDFSNFIKVSVVCVCV